jgi:hypothetical protein
VADGVGYDSIDPQGNKNLFVGYFQSYRWLESPDVRKKMHSLRLVKPSPKILKYLQLANVEAPLVVHFRFGDYKNEHSFGIPHSNYYKVAIERELSTNKYNKVWVFSDEPILAASVLKFLPPSIIRWIPEIDNSASQTFEVMRFGNGYIIANSTFSWWGAMLSYNKNSNVIAPFPWFRKLQIPLDLIPKDWALVNAWNTGQN